MKYNLLPEDIVRNILSYNNKIKYRNGKYMNQICKTDERYKLLLKMQRISNDIYNENVYGVYINCHVYDKIIYKSTSSVFYVDLEDDIVTYTFCYDIADNPDVYHTWTRE